MKSLITVKKNSTIRNLISISLGLVIGTALVQAAPAKRTTMELQMSGGNGCPKSTSVTISHLSQDEVEIVIPNIKVSADAPANQSKSCRLALKLDNGENHQFAVVGASFQLVAKIEKGTNSRVTLETYAQGINPDTKTDLVFTGPKEVNELVTTRHEPKWSSCSGGRLFNTGLSVRMGKVGGGPAVGNSTVEVSGPVKLKLKWQDCPVSASL